MVYFFQFHPSHFTKRNHIFFKNLNKIIVAITLNIMSHSLIHLNHVASPYYKATLHVYSKLSNQGF